MTTLSALSLVLAGVAIHRVQCQCLCFKKCRNWEKFPIFRFLSNNQMKIVSWIFQSHLFDSQSFNLMERSLPWNLRSFGRTRMNINKSFKILSKWEKDFHVSGSINFVENTFGLSPIFEWIMHTWMWIIHLLCCRPHRGNYIESHLHNWISASLCEYTLKREWRIMYMIGDLRCKYLQSINWRGDNY